MKLWLLALVLASSLLLVAGMTEHKTPEASDIDRIDWVSDPTCRLVFHSVLEGLYTDGVQNECRRSCADLDPKTKSEIRHPFRLLLPAMSPRIRSLPPLQMSATVPRSKRRAQHPRSRPGTQPAAATRQW